MFSNVRDIKMVFSLGKIFVSDEDIISFELYKAPWRAKIGTIEVTLQYKLRSFQTPEKPKTANLINEQYIN